MLLILFIMIHELFPERKCGGKSWIRPLVQIHIKFECLLPFAHVSSFHQVLWESTHLHNLVDKVHIFIDISPLNMPNIFLFPGKLVKMEK